MSSFLTSSAGRKILFSLSFSSSIRAASSLSTSTSRTQPSSFVAIPSSDNSSLLSSMARLKSTKATLGTPAAAAAATTTTTTTKADSSAANGSGKKTRRPKKAEAAAEEEIPSTPPSPPRLPAGLSSLLEPRGNSDRSFPSAHVVARVVRKTHAAGATLDELEHFLIKRCNPKRKKFEHYSNYALRYWRKGERRKGLERLEELLLRLLESGKERMPLKRAEYFLTVSRACQVMDGAAAAPDGDADAVEDLRFVEDMCDKACAADRPDHALAFFFWITLVKSGSEKNIHRARRLLDKHPAIINLLEKELASYAQDYTGSEKDQSTSSIPSAFSLGDVDKFAEGLMSSTVNLDEATTYKVLCYKALSQWNSGRFSDGLSNAAVALEFLVRNLREDEEVRCGLGRTAVTCLSSMLREASTGQAVAAETERRAGEEASGANAELVRAVREAAGTKSGKTVDMVPALQFVELVCERLAKSHPHAPPLVPYLLWIQLSSAEQLDRAGEILKKYPSIEKIRHPKMEKSLTHPSTKHETRDFFVGEFLRDFVKQLDAPTDDPRSGISQHEDEDDGGRRLSPELRRDMLDLRVLEALRSGDPDAAVAMAVGAAAAAEDEGGGGGVIVSEVVLAELVRACLQLDSEEEGASLLSTLKYAMPPKSAEADIVYDLTVSASLRRNHFERWLRDRRCEAVRHLCQEYRSLLEEEFQLSFEGLDSILVRARNYLRLYLEEALDKFESSSSETTSSPSSSSSILSTAESEATRTFELHGDLSLLVTTWEAIFFASAVVSSPSSPSSLAKKKLADRFLQAHPGVPRHMDVDRCLSRARRSGREEAFRELLQTCLRFDLGDYEKTRAYEGLLVFQCERGDLRGARATLDNAEMLGVKVGADAAAAFLNVQKEMAAEARSRKKWEDKEGILAKIARFLPFGKTR